MAGIFNGPPRGGTRGGRDQFDWNQVKTSQDREYYLGHSVKALTGRWQKNKDVYWYSKDKAGGAEAEEIRRREVDAVKQREEEMMMEALGLKPKKRRDVKPRKLDEEEMQHLLGKGPGGEEGDDGGDIRWEEEQVKGLGYTASRSGGGQQAGRDREVMGGVGIGDEYRERSSGGGEKTRRGEPGVIKSRGRIKEDGVGDGNEDGKRSRRKRESKRHMSDRHKRKRHRSRSPESRKESRRRAEHRYEREGRESSHHRQRHRHRSRSR